MGCWPCHLCLGRAGVDAALTRHAISEMADKSWLRRGTEKAFSKALMRAYKTVRVEPQRFLIELRAAHGLPVTSFQGMYTVEPPVLDTIAEQIIHSNMKIAAIEGGGLRFRFSHSQSSKLSPLTGKPVCVCAAQCQGMRTRSSPHSIPRLPAPTIRLCDVRRSQGRARCIELHPAYGGHGHRDRQIRPGGRWVARARHRHAQDDAGTTPAGAT